MIPRLSGSDAFTLLLVASVVGAFFAVLVGSQGSDGRNWWRSRFGVGWPSLLFLYCLLVVGLWLPLAFGSRFPGDEDLLYGAACLLFVGGCLPFARAVGNLRTYLRVALTAPVRGSDASPTRLAVEGTVEPADRGDAGALEAPLSGDRVVAYRLKVDTVPADGTDRERRRNRETVANVERAREFAVRDATGAVRVDPSGAELRIAGGGERAFAPDEAVPDSLAAFLDAEGIDRAGSELLCEEATLAPGDDAYVLGRASRSEFGVVVDGGREFLVVPGSRRDAVRRTRAVVLWGGGAGATLALVGVAAMSVLTGALSF